MHLNIVLMVQDICTIVHVFGDLNEDNYLFGTEIFVITVLLYIPCIYIYNDIPSKVTSS